MTSKTTCIEDLASPTCSPVCAAASTPSMFEFNHRQNRDYFDITTSTFFQRLFYPFLFWRNTFFEINDGKGEQYGLVWLIVTYTIILGLSSSLNEYFIEPENYKFETEIMMKALGLATVFKVAEPLIYSAVIGCLGGFIYTNQV